MGHLHDNVCPDCNGKGLVKAKACPRCHGIGYEPVNKETLADMARILAQDLPDKERQRPVETMETVTRLQGIQEAWERLTDDTFPV